MAAPAKLSVPPIVEAVLDIKALQRPDLGAHEFRDLAERLKEDYPNVHDQHECEVGFKLRPSDPSEASANVIRVSAILFKSQDEKRIAQYRLDGFSYHQLSTYLGWKLFSTEAYRLWDYYRALARPRAVARVALRYINRLKAPNEGDQLSEFITAEPPIPEGLPQKLAGFSSKLHIVGDSGRNVTLTQALSPTQRAERGLLIDIDAFSTFDESPNEEQLRAVFEELRGLKNKAFFAAVQERALEAFK